MEFKDYYKTLGVTRSATTADIKKAFRKQARQHHPDLNPGNTAAADTFKELNEAHEVLSDPDKRRKYDQFGQHWKHAKETGGGGDPFASGRPFDGPDGFRWSVRTGPDGRSADPAGGANFSDFFRSIFGEDRPDPFTGAGARRPAPARGGDLEHALELTIEEAWHGTSRRLSFQSPTGGPPRTVEVKIPAGAKQGSRVRVAGKGQPGRGGHPDGDLYLVIGIAPHPRFELRGQNLHVRTTVPLVDAVLGGEAEVPTPAGPAVRVKVQAGTQPGQVMRLRGKGLPGRRAGAGDLFVTVDVEIPRHLSPEATRHYEALARLDPGSPRGTDTQTARATSSPAENEQ